MSAATEEQRSSPRVFISYSQHDPAGHSLRVRALAQALSNDGIDVELDQYHQHELIDWPRWCEERLRPEYSDFVLMICSAEYKRRIEDRVDFDKGRGVFWEGNLIYHYLYTTKANERFISILLDNEVEDSLPRAIANWTWFRLREFGTSSGNVEYIKLYRSLTTQPAVIKPKPGHIVSIPPETGPKSISAVADVEPTQTTQIFDVFLSHSHLDASVVEYLAERIKDDVRLQVCLDKWIPAPGGHWQQEIARGLQQAKACAVLVGGHTPRGWFREEIERALNRQTKDQRFRVIPVILPGGDKTLIDDFLEELRTWVDFSEGLDNADAFHLLVSGIKGMPPGRRSVSPLSTVEFEGLREKLQTIRALQQDELIAPALVLEYQRKLLDQSILK
jgi:hypothetical protein